MSDLNTPQAPASYEHHCASLNQQPPEVAGQSPLHHADLATHASQGPAQGNVIFRELPLLGHLTLRGSQSNTSFMQGCASVLGTPLPITPLSMVTHHDVSIRWISPDEWLVILPNSQAFAVEQSLRACITGHYSIVNVSGGQTLIELSGPDAVNVLKKSMSLDVHPSVFPVGKVASSLFAKTTAILSHTDENCYQLVIRRSFSDYIWLWIQAASQEYGLVVRT